MNDTIATPIVRQLNLLISILNSSFYGNSTRSLLRNPHIVAVRFIGPFIKASFINEISTKNYFITTFLVVRFLNNLTTICHREQSEAISWKTCSLGDCHACFRQARNDSGEISGYFGNQPLVSPGILEKSKFVCNVLGSKTLSGLGFSSITGVEENLPSGGRLTFSLT